MELRKSCGVSFRHTNHDMLFIRYVVSILYFTIILKLCAISLQKNQFCFMRPSLGK